MRDRIIEIGRDSAWYFTASLITAFLGFMAVPIFTRLFTPSEYGIYSLVTIGVLLGTPIFSGWINQSVIRFYPEYKNKGELDVFYSTVLHWAPFFMLFFLLLVLPATAFLPLGEYRRLVGLGIAVFSFFSLFNVLQSTLRARQMSWQFAALLVLVQSGRFIGGAALVFCLNSKVEGPFWGWLGALLIAIPLELALLSVRKQVRWSKYSSALFRRFIRYGFPLILVVLLTHVLTAADRYMLMWFKGSEEVGLYSVVYTIVASIETILVSFVSLGTFPVVMKVYESEGEDATVSLVGKVTRYVCLLLFPVIAGVCVLHYRLITVLTTPSYQDASSIVLPLAFGILLANILWIPFIAFQVKKKTNVVLIPVGLAATTNIGINLVLIPRYGYAGAAWATLVSYILCFILTLVFSLRYMEWRVPWVDVVKIAVSSAVMGGALYMTQRVMTGGWVGLAVLTILGAMIYLACLLVAGELRKSELSFVFTVVSRPGATIRAMFRDREKTEDDE